MEERCIGVHASGERCPMIAMTPDGYCVLCQPMERHQGARRKENGMRRIYVAGPYSHATRTGRIENTHRAMEAGYALMKRGHAVFVPHLSHFIEEHALLEGLLDERAYDFWLRQDFTWLDACDALLYLAPSHGADLELERAKARGMQVYYSVDDVPDAA